MKNKLWIEIAIILSIILIISITITIGIERNMTEKTLSEKKVSAQEVKDTTPPVITLKGNKHITIKAGEKYREPGYSAIDDVDGSVVGKVIVSKQTISNNQYKLIYRVSDRAGNITQAERIINIEQPDIIKQAEINRKNNTNIITNENIIGNRNNEITSNDNHSNANNIISSNTIDDNTTTNNITNNIVDSNITQNNAIQENKMDTENNYEENKNQNNNAIIKNNTDKNTSKVNDEKGVIYLTFDDGPTNSSTPKILDILKKHGVKATFFILNYNSNTEKLVKREVAEGHSIGIHGYSHDYKKIYTSEDAYMKNLDKLQAKIYKSTGVKTTITRFPGGSSNTISKFNPGIMKRLSKLVVQKGYTYYDWNVDSNDAGGAKNAESVYKNVTKGLSKKWRNIVLMHDFSGNSKTIDALERIIEYGKENGYTFKAITANTKMMQHGINN